MHPPARSAGSTFPGARRGRRGTYSVVAHDGASGAVGVAIQSHWFSVGSLAIAASAGVGAIATQANPDVHHKPRAMALLRDGADASAVSAALLADDPAAQHRQLAVVDAQGRVAGWTGGSCIAAAGHIVGDGFVCQANMMRSAAIWPAMSEAMSAGGGLTARLLAALDAGEAAGGDIRGRQSAAILVVPATGDDADRIVDLRVEDSLDPLGELRRLVLLNDAYVLADAGDAAIAVGEHAEATEHYLAAYAIAPENDELRFWAGLGLITAGVPDRGVELLRRTIQTDPSWRELLGRLEPQVAPSAAEAERLLGP